MTKNEDKILLALWVKLASLKAGNKCEWCGCTNTLNAHHIYSRSNKLVRYDEDNGIILCAGHHVLNKLSAHKAPFEFQEWIRKKRGENWYIMLRLKAFPQDVHQKPDYKLIKLYLEQEIKKYEKNKTN